MIRSYSYLSKQQIITIFMTLQNGMIFQNFDNSSSNICVQRNFSGAARLQNPLTPVLWGLLIPKNGSILKDKSSASSFTKRDIYILGISGLLSFAVVFLFPNVDANDHFLSILLFSLSFLGLAYSIVPIYTGKYGWWIDIPFLVGECRKVDKPVLFWLGVILRFLASGFILYLAIKLTF